MKTIALRGAAIAAFLALAAAPAGAAQEDVTARVDVSDLNPADPADAAEIDRRIATAVRRVCGAPDARTMTAIARVETCRAQSASRAQGR